MRAEHPVLHPAWMSRPVVQSSILREAPRSRRGADLPSAVVGIERRAANVRLVDNLLNGDGVVTLAQNQRNQRPMQRATRARGAAIAYTVGGLRPGVLGPVPVNLLPFTLLLALLFGSWFLLPQVRYALISADRLQDAPRPLYV